VYTLAITLTIAANLGYHFAQKSIDPQADPMVSLVATYAAALAISLGWLLATGGGPRLVAGIGQLGWPSWLLGGCVVLLELGFLLAYRAGWPVQTAALYSNVAVAVLLVPVGLFAFQESLSPQRIAGFALAIAALVLLTR